MLRLAFLSTTPYTVNLPGGPHTYALPDAGEVMGHARERRDLKRLKNNVKLHAACLDSFRVADKNSLIDVDDPIARITYKDVCTHGAWVAAGVAYGLFMQGYDPSQIALEPFESTIADGTSTDEFRLDQSEAIKTFGEKTPLFIGTVCSTGPRIPFEEYDKRKERTPNTNRLLDNASAVVKKLARWPAFFSNTNNDNQDGLIGALTTSPVSINVASHSQLGSEKHKYIDIFTAWGFKARIKEDGFDFDDDGITDYFCKIINKDAVGAYFVDNQSNSIAAPCWFGGEYATSLLEYLKRKTDYVSFDTFNEIKHIFNRLHLHDYAFPCEMAYRGHATYKARYGEPSD